MIRNVLIRDKLVLRNHFPRPIANLLHKDKEILAFTNNFRVTKKFLITKYDCTLAFCGLWHFFLPGYSTNFVTLITILFLWISTKNWLTALSNSFSYIFLSLCTHNWHHTTALLSKKTTVDEQIFLKEKNPSCNKTKRIFSINTNVILKIYLKKRENKRIEFWFLIKAARKKGINICNNILKPLKSNNFLIQTKK